MPPAIARCRAFELSWPTSAHACWRSSPGSTDRGGLPAHDESLAPHIGGPEQCAMLSVDADERRPGVHHERADDTYLVAETLERLDDIVRHPALDFDDTGANERMIAEALVVVERVEPRRFDRLLRTHAEHRDVEKDLERLLILAVSPGAAEGQEGPAVAKDDRRAQGRAGALAALGQVRVSVLVQHECLHPVAERDPGIASDEDAPEEPPRGRRRGKQVAPSVDDIDTGRVRRFGSPCTDSG